jgi:hypothetical protein
MPSQVATVEGESMVRRWSAAAARLADDPEAEIEVSE